MDDSLAFVIASIKQMTCTIVSKYYTILVLYSELCTRKFLDKCLARGLSLPLHAVIEQVNGTTQYKTLQLIDDENYILTLDYTLKMLNIHERRECGIPVIIEGETGVGKTELLKILSKLWNYTWVVQWSEIKRKFQSILRDIQDSEFVLFHRDLL